MIRRRKRGDVNREKIGEGSEERIQRKGEEEARCIGGVWERGRKGE